ncbi:hypothetical protein [Maribacter hydrothermalis]|uniref:Uncharacterized protein n=1 Tax=Maribacter hydrothermalis TaxID=1836467 RepID=A0A1B7Z712_9FLAO|nr:hypothetical protein [Maribacter hydrothermalis]APQ16397.1 hypothetical protein BTR34_03155 [Maribacter hydrothermalis]OBR38499.1 hypothetical protein A9200_17665 [Maribacter hydrothermalis]
MEYNSPKFKKWLDKLQQESWQLELIISGFAIYGLFAAYEPLEYNASLAMNSQKMIHGILWSIINTAIVILIFNLVIHVVLRGLWIGAIGLRYVSGDIDFDSLNYSERFTNYLKIKVGSFDKFISKLENLCSIVFALSFLMIFYVIAFYAILSFLGIFIFFLKEMVFIPKLALKILLIATLPIIIVGVIMVFIDFIGQGILKKKKWTSKIYFPFYKMFSYLTLSFLYRPLVYNFLDNKFSRKLILFIIPFYLTITILTSFDDIKSNYLSNDLKSSEFYSNLHNYEDKIIEKNNFVRIASIPSQAIRTPYLKVFLLFNEDMESYIFEANNNLKPESDKRGLSITFFDQFLQGFNGTYYNGLENNSIIPQYIETFNIIYNLEIDGKAYKSEFVISNHNKDLLGFETYLDINNLGTGKHILTIKGPTKENEFDDKSQTIEKIMATIPFWYFPENSTPTNIRNTSMQLDSITSK